MAWNAHAACIQYCCSSDITLGGKKKNDAMIQKKISCRLIVIKKKKTATKTYFYCSDPVGIRVFQL